MYHTGMLLISVTLFRIYIIVGLSALLGSTDRAMREPLDRGLGKRLAPRFSLCMH